MQETLVWSLGWEDPLEEGMATNSSILARRSPWTAEPGRLQSIGLQRVKHDWVTKHSTEKYYCILNNDQYFFHCGFSISLIKKLYTHTHTQEVIHSSQGHQNEEKYLELLPFFTDDWPTTLCKFYVHNIMIQYFHTLQNDHNNRNLEWFSKTKVP